MNYRFKRCSYIKADPQAAGELCERLEANGRLTAKNLVEESRPVGAPLHDAFEWNDSVAGELYREQQARHIIASLEVVTVNNVEPVRAFFSIVRSEPEYRHIDAILTSADDTEALLRMAYRELQAFQKKYSQLERLKGVFRAIDDLGITA